MLPAWLGAGAALKHVIEQEGKQNILDEMWQQCTIL